MSAFNFLTVENTATDGKVVLSGLADSFEGTVGVRVVGPDGKLVLDDSSTAAGCCEALFPWTYTLDTDGWPPGDYTLMCLTDDPIGLAQGSDGPEIDTKTLAID